VVSLSEEGGGPPPRWIIPRRPAAAAQEGKSDLVGAIGKIKGFYSEGQCVYWPGDQGTRCEGEGRDDAAVERT